ncbi:MAG: tetratricopeptide repeat protein [Steroidobacteraceae bacterium]|jgi:tetratricopeptide (TPR) repeat protein|nr:tetratricopeptide repeat protein [Steroidobacteraceae bacterium]
MKDQMGYELTGGTAQALDAYEQALHEMRCLTGNPVATLAPALAQAPDFAMAQLLNAWMHVSSTELPAIAIARESLAAARRLALNEREELHAAAIGQWCDGQWHAAARTLEDLNALYPHDALALQMGQQLDFFTGDSRMLRDRMLRVLPSWSEEVPGYHAVLGMLAFGLEETGDYARAEAAGRRAVELEPLDAWAQHAVAHVYEMQGRREEGIRWMHESTGWQESGFFLVHNWWHLALHHLARGETAEALELYDGAIRGNAASMMDLIDCSAMLWRLELAGLDVGGRWTGLADAFAPHAASGNYAFNDLHAAMAFARAGREDLLRSLRTAQAVALTRRDDNAEFVTAVGAPAIEAMVAFAAGDHAQATSLLRTIRNRAARFGGSHAQRDLLDQTLIAAARSSGNASLAKAVETEREQVLGYREFPVQGRPAFALAS